jgi:ribonuclease HI
MTLGRLLGECYTCCMTEEVLIVHTDGGARGNPGQAACAFVVEADGKVLFKASRFLGKTTNNLAEYQGVLAAIKYLSANRNLLSGRRVVFYLDSELVVRQLAGLYKIKNENLKELNEEIKKIISKELMDISFKNIPRSQNKIADYLVNKELDKNS